MAFFLTAGFYFNFSFEEEKLVEDDPTLEQDLQFFTSDQSNYDDPQLEQPSEGVSTYIGQDIMELVKVLGQPSRIDPSAYDYDWWIYNNDLSQYIQVGVANKKIVTLYAVGSDVNVAPFKIGQRIEDIYSLIPINPTISLEYEGSSYRFELSENDMNIRPLIRSGDYYVQLNIDKFAGELSSIRYLDAETLVKLKPYELVYLGELLEVDPATALNEESIEAGSEQQVFDITNIMRIRHGVEPLDWDENIREVAFAHSVDMYESNDFSHTSKTYGELADRLENGGIFYQLAGENIAANYIDAPAVMEGWLNSKGHRDSLLNGEFTHLGVGIYKRYYTQNFVQKWE